ncbi:MAG TPA: polysaccharide deacetylase family protein [Nitrospirota bacterium]|nr:polysaccharide deacetylase family protein [Nitrospirota bacterium]
MSMTRRTFLKLTGAAALSSSALPHSLYAAGARIPDRRIPALLYHDISNVLYDEYTISPATFSAQMEWLYATGYRTLPANEVEQFLKNTAGRAVMLTFDDGDISFMDYAFPLLKDYGFKATMNIIGQAVESHALIDRQRPVLSWDECRYLLSSGLVDVGCHSYALHTPGGVLNVSYGAIEKDLTLFQERYKQELGKRCTVLAWPYGIYDKKCIEIARHAGFSCILTSREGFIEKKSDLRDLPRLNINNKLDLISFQQYLGANP